MEQKYRGLIPITLYGHLNDNQAEDYETWVSWTDLLEEFLCSSVKYIESKEKAVLFCSAHFKRGQRAAKYLIHSGMLILDVDDGATVDDALNLFQQTGIAGMIYTTASHTDQHHKFRICVPLMEPVSPNTYTQAWHGLNHLFGNIADISKKTCESMFYVPGRLHGQPDGFLSFDGTVHSAEEWVELAPKQSLKRVNNKTIPRGATRSKTKKYHSKRGLPPLEWDDVNGIDIYRNPIVPTRAIDKYFDRSENWHHARYGFMCSVACKAATHGYDLTPLELQSIFNDLDHEDGGHYTGAKHQQEIQRDTTKAINNAT